MAVDTGSLSDDELRECISQFAGSMQTVIVNHRNLNAATPPADPVARRDLINANLRRMRDLGDQLGACLGELERRGQT